MCIACPTARYNRHARKQLTGRAWTLHKVFWPGNPKTRKCVCNIFWQPLATSGQPMFDAVLAWSQVGNWPWWGVNSQGGFELTNGTTAEPMP